MEERMEERMKPISKEAAKACRHHLERRWYRRLIELNLLVIIIVVGVFIHNFEKTKQSAINEIKQVEQKVSGTSDEDLSITKAVDPDELSDEVKYFFMGIFILIGFFVGMYVIYAKYRATAVRITSRNFPEVYEMIEEYSYRLGIPAPKAYVKQSNGILNAFSTFIIKKRWIEINSEVLEVAYRENKDFEALGFIIAHELSHIYYGHATFQYNLPILFVRNLPVIGTTASRAREFSCDRLAQLITGNDGLDAMIMLTVDRHLYKMVDKEDYIEDQKQQKGFFIWVVNLFADHPVMCKRIVALTDKEKDGKLY